MIPYRLHALIWLDSTRVICSTLHVGRILVVAGYQMDFVAVALISYLEDIVGAGGHGPVISSEYTLVIIDKVLTSNLGKEARPGVQTDPGLVDIESGLVGTAPRAIVLD